MQIHPKAFSWHETELQQFSWQTQGCSSVVSGRQEGKGEQQPTVPRDDHEFRVNPMGNAEARSREGEGCYVPIAE